MPPFQPALMAAIYHLLGPTLAARNPRRFDALARRLDKLEIE